MRNKETSELLNILNDINTFEALDKHLDTNLRKIDKQSFAKYFISLSENKGLKKNEILKTSQLSKSYFYQILDGSKNPSRDYILNLCISAKFSLEETNRGLSLGKSSHLYAKDLRDSILIFCINKGKTIIETNEILYDKDLPTL